ncbi:DNA repair protein XRCC4-like isoform X2 [Anneissia japonica]|nr:DNA repair protein XRCC4-like isoform X2 [Anneissia japonica]XP_033118551.1 DNA repair protein XRCC4-like isoform X2 [Anneissia japonica]
MKSLSEAINMSVDDFTEQTMNAMTQQEMKHFQYDVKDCGLDRVFYWKKVMASGDIKFQLGSVTLTAVDDTNATTHELYKFAIDQIKTLKGNIRRLDKENSRLSKERKQALQQLEQCTTAKEDLENDLYSKFQVIVNDKKAKIRQLQEELKNVDGGRKREQDESNQSTMRNDSSDEPEDDDQEEMDTDDELTNVKVQQKSKKQKVELTGNDSLLLDDDEEEPTAAAASSKRRIRKTAPKKQSESSVILPTKTAKQTPTRTPSTSKNVPHMRRTGSSRSNQSDQDPDDLFNEL